MEGLLRRSAGIRRNIAMLAVFGVVVGCMRPIAPVPAAADREAGRARLARFEEAWLEPARIAPPTVSDDAQLVEGDGVSARVRILRAEEAAWNDWPVVGT